MRYRKLDANGDYTFGGNSNNTFFVNVPDAVAQLVQTRLGLWTGQWFTDISDGTPFQTDILGANTRSGYDIALQDRIRGTQGVSDILTYNSTLQPTSARGLGVQANINTIYGEASVNT